MDDLISRKALLYTIRKDAMPITLTRVFTHIHASPAVDPVHAAGACYCRECKHYDHGCCVVKRYIGDDHIISMPQDGFCSFGRRRED